MQVIGKASLLWDNYMQYVTAENAHANNREPGWYVSVRNKVPVYIDNMIWKSYDKTGEGPSFPFCIISDWRLKEIRQHQEFIKNMGLYWEVLFHNEDVTVLRSGNLVLGLPSDTVEYFPYEDVDSIPIGELRNRIGTIPKENEVALHSGVSRNEIKNNISEKQEEIDRKKEEIQNLEKQKKEELEQIKQELEKKYADKMRIIEEKKAEMEIQMKNLEQQMFLLDTEIYSIRCFMGETVDFVHLLKGAYSSKKEPVVVYQKIRYLDEEMGKWISLYDFDGKDIGTFEELIKNREDMREIFAPGPKSVSLVKVSKSPKRYCMDPYIANTLDTYRVLHGNMIGILLRDGENLWIGWTDEDKISIPDENAFYKPGNREETIDEAPKSSTKEEVASRYFIYSILRGIIHEQKLIHLPENTELGMPNPYVIFSMADGWLEDNRYGTFADIVNRTDAPLMKGDMILTTLSITRDDAHSGFLGGRNTKFQPWNNDRGRGEKNRTHDASIPDRKVLPVNCIDIEQDYIVVYRKYRLHVEEKFTSEYIENGIKHTRTAPVTTRTEEYLGTANTYHTAYNNMLLDKYPIKGMALEQVAELLMSIYPEIKSGREYIDYTPGYINKGSYYTVFDHIELGEFEQKNYVSAQKGDYSYWGEKKHSYANMQIMPNEYLNLTFLNSVYLEYAIRNRKIGGWRRGSSSVDYTDSIPYLNTALEYIRKREKEEAEMLGKYMELYDGWQVDVSEWRLRHNYHRLTDTRAKKYASEQNKTGV